MFVAFLQVALFFVFSWSAVATDPTNLTTIEIHIPGFSPGATSEAATQRVSYFIDNGVAIMDGDIVFATEEQLIKHKLNKRALSRFKTEQSLLWPAGIVQYKWESQKSKDDRLNMWMEATRRWMNMLPFLVFNDTGVISIENVTDIVTLRATYGKQLCSSPIGKTTDPNQNSIQLDDKCSGGAGAFAHEIGHTLGLYHEHVRPDRDSHIKIHCENLGNDNNNVPPKCGEDCAGLGCQFRKNAPEASDYSGPYDSLSIMHYGKFEGSKNGHPVIEALPGVQIKDQHSFPTAMDARRICDFYPVLCKGVCGDGVLSEDNGEQCDDGNNIDGDGCSANCQKESPKK